MQQLHSFITTRHPKIKRTFEEQAPRIELTKDSHRRQFSLSVNKKQPKQTLIKINKKLLPKDFFTAPQAHLTPRVTTSQMQKKQSRQSNQQTSDTPNPSSHLVSFQQSEMFNRTSFFGQDEIVSRTIPVKDVVGHCSNEKRSPSKGRVRGKLTAIPVLQKSSSYNAPKNQLYNCTFSRDFSHINSPFSQSVQSDKPQQTSYRKMVVNQIGKWSNIVNMDSFIQSCKKDFSPKHIGDFRLRKKALISHRPTSLFPKICP